MAYNYKRVMLGVVFYRSPCYYRVEVWDDTDQKWICLNLNSKRYHYFKERYSGTISSATNLDV